MAKPESNRVRYVRERREERLAELERSVAAGELVIRQATKAERVLYRIREPQAAPAVTDGIPRDDPPPGGSQGLRSAQNRHDRDYAAEIAALLADGRPRTAVEIAAPRAAGGCGANGRAVRPTLKAHPGLFRAITGAEAVALGRKASVVLWVLA